LYRIIEGSTQYLKDVDDFIETLNHLDGHPELCVRNLFDAQEPLIVTRAPGRLDVMGGIADYSGSLVLQLPIGEATLVALQRASDRMIRLVSLHSDDQRPLRTFEMSLDDLENQGYPLDYNAAKQFFRRNPSDQWAGYVAGAFLVLMREKQQIFPHGAQIFIHSDVPEGKGVSSSAALEVASMQAVMSAFDIKCDPRETALLCQKVENLIVGAPCGVMDQMTSVCGEKNKLLSLLCQPAELRGFAPIPEEISFWGIDSGIRHSVSGADYGSVRTGAFMGYRMIAESAGLKVEQKGPDFVSIVDPVWNGYLANVTPSEFETQYASHIPEDMQGASFISQFKNITDPVTRIEPERTYAVRVPTAHPIYEHTRVRQFSELLARNVSESQLSLLGKFMVQSHASYSACGLGSRGTDRLVELVMTQGKNQGLYGAKITGGGSGGTVVAMGRFSSGPVVDAIAEQYAGETGHAPVIFRGSSNGSHSFGMIRLEPVKQ